MGPEVDDAPLYFHATVAELSERLWMVWDRMLTDWANISNWGVVAASSSSLLVILPMGLMLDMRHLGTSVGQWLQLGQNLSVVQWDKVYTS
jgi:hypothetical protein